MWAKRSMREGEEREIMENWKKISKKQEKKREGLLEFREFVSPKWFTGRTLSRAVNLVEGGPKHSEGNAK